MFPDFLLLENTFIQFYISPRAFTQFFLEKNVKYLPCLTTESNLKPCKGHFIYSQTIFSSGGNLSKLPTVLEAWVRPRAIILCSGPKFGQNKVLLHADNVSSYHNASSCWYAKLSVAF